MGNSKDVEDHKDPKREYEVRYAVEGSQRVEPVYADEHDIMRSYREVHRQYGEHTALQELHALLKPLVGRINRIVIIGLGAPRRGDMVVFKQLALIHHAAKYLEQHAPNKAEKVEVYQQDPSTQDLDERFLKLLGIETLPFDWESNEADTRSTSYTLTVRDKAGKVQECVAGSSSERAFIKDVLIDISASTLLYMPNLYFGITLRYIERVEKLPRLIITNALAPMWERIVLMRKEFGHADKKTSETWQGEWDAEWNGWNKLVHQCERKELVQNQGFIGRCGRFWAYKPMLAWEAQRGWETGVKNLDLDIKHAREELVYQHSDYGGS